MLILGTSVTTSTSPIISRRNGVTPRIADSAAAQRFGCRRGVRHLHVSGLRHDPVQIDLPIGHVEAMIDERYAALIDDLPKLRTSIVTAIEARFGERVARIDQEIAAASIPAPIAPLLQVSEGTPALLIRRTYRGHSNRAFEVSIGYYPTGRFVYRNALLRRY